MSVNYSIIKSEQGNIAVQSTVQSFNLDHITNKDIVSFYERFSQFAAWDTGLLPVEGSGILSIRTAGPYTQFAYQHKPGLYHVNWGKSEGSAAAAYYVAQPYRIIICDMKEGNLLGARMFYSPYPITNPTQPLYHVNLPNINCKGYRGNAVGWICLYQNENWDHLPLNERIVRFIERCSGVETYNDANMSETDGTRFYQDHKKPSYFWDPVQWESKSALEGFEWTLDQNLLIPVLVNSMDDQGKHVDGGVPLTLADALVGDYQAYYYDTVHTKPINAIIRPDKQLSEEEVLSYFTSSYNVAGTKNNLLFNTFNESMSVKDKTGSTKFTGSSLTNAPQSHNDSNDSDEDQYVTCSICEDSCDPDSITDDYYDNSVCSSCLEDQFTYIESVDGYFNVDGGNIVYSEKQGKYFHTSYDTIEVCNCETIYGKSGQDNGSPEKVMSLTNGDVICPECIEGYADQYELDFGQCFACNAPVITNPGFSYHFATGNVNAPFIDFETMETKHQHQTITLCFTCSTSTHLCPCGTLKQKNEEGFNPCDPTIIDVDGNSLTINKACASCVAFDFSEEGKMTAVFTPISIDGFINFHNSKKETPVFIAGLHNPAMNDDPF
jgi:hypothetical protein